MTAMIAHLWRINEHNLKVLRSSPVAEISGSLGDLGTLLPLMLALTLSGSIDLSSTLVFSGLTNIFTGLIFGIPLPVQPMKAIASVATSQRYSIDQTVSAGLFVSIAVSLFSLTGLMRFVTRVVPVPVVRGIQVGAGLSLVISAGSSLLMPLHWSYPSWADNWNWALGAFFLLLLSAIHPRYVPFALLTTVVGLVLSSISPNQPPSHTTSRWLWQPSLFVPRWNTFIDAAVNAGLPQLPLTTLNSVLAVSSLAQSFSPPLPTAPSTTALGLSVGAANLVGAWFGAMPVCHGSGGLAAQWRFGARSGSSVVVLGLVKLLLGLFVGEKLVGLLRGFPRAILGVMVIAAGVELAKVGRDMGGQAALWEDASSEHDESNKIKKDSEDRWMVMLVTVAGCLAFKNDAIGFAAGMAWHWGLELEGRRKQRQSRRGAEREPLLS